MYQIATSQFSGPIGKLLELIEEKKLDITEFNLAQVTGDFLNYLAKAESIHPRLLADFIVIASRLILIKSKVLLPGVELGAEEEKEIKDLEERLRFYQSFKPAIKNIKNLWEGSTFCFSRPFLLGRPVFFYPAKNIDTAGLRAAINGIFESLEYLEKETQTISSTLIRLEDKIQEILAVIRESQSRAKKSSFGFQELKKEKPREEIIVMFLALLQLIHEQLVKVEQKKQFSDIIIKM
ncbi:MAG: segregation/condensation protein A [Candidatus Magasanikbacteria bacterium]|nr:segregation/condensation protein A [Candidatus Magasanikbacteria bacterium]